MDEFDSESNDERAHSRWGFVYSWTSFLLVAFVLYELTSQAFLGVTIFCCKFGWKYFRTAIWLRRQDPDSPRGKMNFWIFLASGLWRMAITGTILMFGLVWIDLAIQGPAAGQRQNGDPPKEFIEAMLVTFVGFFVSSLTKRGARHRPSLVAPKKTLGGSRNQSVTRNRPLAAQVGRAEQSKCFAHDFSSCGACSRRIVSCHGPDLAGSPAASQPAACQCRSPSRDGGDGRAVLRFRPFGPLGA